LSILAEQLKSARINRGFSQSEIATMLHISRQSISKWENGRGYPDLDNLVRLSEIYQVSIDELLKEDDGIKIKLKADKENVEKRKLELQGVSQGLYQNRDEGLFLMLLTLVSGIFPPVGVVLPMYTIWRNNKYNSLYKTIFVVASIVIVISLITTVIFVRDSWLEPTHTEIYRIN